MRDNIVLMGIASTLAHLARQRPIYEWARRVSQAKTVVVRETARTNHAFLRLLIVWILLIPTGAVAQSPISDQKEVVAFIFGTVHPLSPDKKPITDANGKPVAIDMPLGTGFFVSYPDERGGPNYSFYYLVTAKHVLRDFDGTFLRNVNVRVNLKSAVGGSKVDFIRGLPVSDEKGNLLWYRGKSEADEAVAIPCLPDPQKVDFKTIPISMFVTDSELKSDDVEEGDSVYFIGLLAQFYGTAQNSPVVRRGTLALMTDEPVPTEKGPQNVFIAELQSWPGNSGSPVFLSLGGLRHGNLLLGGNLRFLGIVLGEFINQIPAKFEGHEIYWGSQQSAYVGISLIVPATQLLDVLNSAEAKRDRDTTIHGLAKPHGSQ